jgi:hypothetical protein
MDKLSTKEEQDEFEKKNLKPIRDEISEIKDYVGIYDKTKVEVEEFEELRQDSLDAILASNYADLTYRLELKLDINDADMQKLEYLLNKYSDNFYKMAESLAIISKD